MRSGAGITCPENICFFFLAFLRLERTAYADCIANFLFLFPTPLSLYFEILPITRRSLTRYDTVLYAVAVVMWVINMNDGE